jgi:hypothetical protein
MRKPINELNPIKGWAAFTILLMALAASFCATSLINVDFPKTVFFCTCMSLIFIYSAAATLPDIGAVLYVSAFISINMVLAFICKTYVESAIAPILAPIAIADYIIFVVGLAISFGKIRNIQ